MIKGIIEKVSKVGKGNEGCYGYEPYLTFKSIKRESANGEAQEAVRRVQNSK